MLLFVTLFYVYPLKFMFDSMFAQFMPAAYPHLKRMSLVELSRASAIYGLGFLVLFSLFALLYRHAYNRRVELGLTPLEVFDTKMYAGHHLVSATVGLVALLVAVAGPLALAFISPTCLRSWDPATGGSALGRWTSAGAADADWRLTTTTTRLTDCRLTTEDCRLCYAQER